MTDSSISPGQINKVHVSIYISVPWFRFTLMDLALRVLFYRFQIICRKLELINKCNQIQPGNYSCFHSYISKPRRSCSWTYKINKLLVSPNERLNNIILLKIQVQKWHTLPSGFDKQLRNSSTTLRNNLPRKQQQLRNSLTTRPRQLRNSSTTRPPTPDARCSRRRHNFVSHEAESFAQRECDVITARPIERPKTPQIFR